MKRTVKSLGLRMAAAGGLFAVGRVLTRRKFRIFAYHGVSSEIDEGINFDGFFVRPQVFEAHLRTLKGHYRVMPLGEILRRIHAGEALPDRAAAITFDDGYANNLREAAPLLAKYGLPATFFVTTGFIDGTHEPWWFALRAAVFGFRSDKSKATQVAAGDSPWRNQPAWKDHPPPIGGGYDSELSLSKVFRMPGGEERELRCLEDRVATVIAWEQALKYMSASERNDTLKQLLPDTRHATPDTSSWSMMSWNDVRALMKQGHEIGAHTISHISLGCEPMDVVSKEVAGSTERIREMTGMSPSVFSYPYGEKEHFSQELADEVARHGYLGAVTTLEGMNSASDNPLLLRRFNVTGHHDRYAFRAVASGLKKW